MDGQDIQEIYLSELYKNRTFRIDSTFYDKTACAYDNYIKSKKHFFIPEKYVVSGPFGSSLTSAAYKTEGIPFIRISNIKGGFSINTNEMIYISEDDNTRLKSSQLFIDDIILSKVGNSVGFYARVDESMKECNISENNIGIKLHNLELSIFQKHFILTYLNSKYGKILTLRRSSGNAQPKLNVFDVAEIPIPVVSDLFAKNISNVLQKSQELLTLANIKYKDADKLLLKEINIDMSTISNDTVSVKYFTESFNDTGRLDAEYYQKRNYDVIDMLNAKGTIKTLCNIYDKTFIPNDIECYQYIELANIGKSGEIDGVDSIIGKNLPSRARRLIKKGHVIVSSIEGSLESCAIVTDSYDNALCSTGFYVIDSESYNSETLLVILKSKPIQMLLKRSCSGTILTNITKDEFLQIPLPDVSETTQRIIKNIVSEAYVLRDKSHKLLNCAKTAVEIAIEQDEATADSWLKSRITELTN